MRKFSPSFLVVIFVFSGCGVRNDLAEIKFVSPRSPEFLELTRYFSEESWDPTPFANCSVQGNDARAIIKGPGIPGGENIINIPGGISVPDTLLTTAGTVVALPPFSIFVPKGDQRVLAISALVEFAGGACNPAGDQKRYLLAGWVGPLSVQQDITVPISLATTAHEIKIVRDSNTPSTSWPVTSALRMATLTGMTCNGTGGTVTGHLRDLVHGLPPFPLSATNSISNPLHVFPVAPNRSYILTYSCPSTSSTELTFTTGPLGASIQQTFTCTAGSPSTCTQN